MKRRKLYLGPRIRRLRKQRALTQGQMATDLGVSPSYVNLVERNQRPVSADLLVRLASAYGFDIGALGGEGEDDLFRTLADAFADRVFAGAGVVREDAHELAAGNPVLGEAVAALYRAYRAAQDDAIEARASGRALDADPVEEARSFLHAHRNHFGALDEAGEAIAGESDPTLGGLIPRLVERFKTQHRLKTRLLPAAVMAGAVRRLNRHSGEVVLNETLDQASRAFHLALQLVLLEQSALLDRTVNAAKFQSDAGRRLARAALANYGAAAILLPYSRFRSSAEELRYDVEAMARRFTASFEQVAHRLTTLQKTGAEGIPFFFLRIDAAGNVSKRYSADVFPFARYGGSCPLWNVHDVFRTPRRIVTQILELPDGQKFLSIARTVHGETSGHGARTIDRAVALGCALSHAGKIVYADGLDLEAAPATPIGVTCRLCERPDCAARAHPPLRRRLVIDEHKRLATPFSFSFD